MLRFKLEQMWWSLKFFVKTRDWEHVVDLWRIAWYKPLPEDEVE